MEDTDVVRRVLDLTDVEVFEARGHLCSPEPLRGVQVLVANPVPVTGSDGNRIGFAMVDVDSSNLETRIFLTKQCPERLDLECGEQYFLKISNANTTAEKIEDDSLLPSTIKSLEIVSIRLASAKGGTNLPLVTRGAW